MSEDFKDGQIVELTLNRFMIYSASAPFKFRRGLNAFLGVNGSGKSSVFIGLYIGLGGDLGGLKRQKRLRDLIHRSGDPSAEILIKIVSDEDEPKRKSKV